MTAVAAAHMMADMAAITRYRGPGLGFVGDTGRAAQCHGMKTCKAPCHGVPVSQGHALILRPTVKVLISTYAGSNVGWDGEDRLPSCSG